MDVTCEQPYLMPPPTPCCIHEDWLRGCGCPHDGEYPHTDTGIKLPCVWVRPDTRTAFIESDDLGDNDTIAGLDHQSASSDYSSDEAQTDFSSTIDYSSCTSSEDEFGGHTHQSIRDTKLSQRQRGPGEHSRQHTLAKAQPYEASWNNTSFSSYSSNSTHHSLDTCIDPVLLNLSSTGIEHIPHKQCIPPNPHKRRRPPECHDRETIIKPGDSATYISLLTAEALLQLESIQTANVSKLKGICAELSAPLDAQTEKLFLALRRLVSNYIQTSAESYHDHLLVEWTAPSPVKCLVPFSGRPFPPNPHDPKKRYVCISGCGKAFKQKNDWVRHMALNWLLSYWQCPCCDEQFESERPEKLYGPKTGHLSTHHSRIEKKNRKRDYRPHVLDEKFRKQCGFCGIVCSSFGSFTSHVEKHFKAGCGMDTWRDPWYETATASTGGDDDHGGQDGDEDEDRGFKDNDGSDQQEDTSNGNGGDLSSGGNSDGFNSFGPDYGKRTQDGGSGHDHWGDYPPMDSDFMDMADTTSANQELPSAESEQHIRARLRQESVVDLGTAVLQVLPLRPKRPASSSLATIDLMKDDGNRTEQRNVRIRRYMDSIAETDGNDDGSLVDSNRTSIQWGETLAISLPVAQDSALIGGQEIHNPASLSARSTIAAGSDIDFSAGLISSAYRRRGREESLCDPEENGMSAMSRYWRNEGPRTGCIISSPAKQQHRQRSTTGIASVQSPQQDHNGDGDDIELPRTDPGLTSRNINQSKWTKDAKSHASEQIRLRIDEASLKEGTATAESDKQETLCIMPRALPRTSSLFLHPSPMLTPPVLEQYSESFKRSRACVWYPGTLRELSQEEQEHLQEYKASSLYWCPDHATYLPVPYDYTTESVRNGVREGELDNSDRLKFDTQQVNGRCISVPGHKNDDELLAAREPLNCSDHVSRHDFQKLNPGHSNQEDFGQHILGLDVTSAPSLNESETTIKPLKNRQREREEQLRRDEILPNVRTLEVLPTGLIGDEHNKILAPLKSNFHNIAERRLDDEFDFNAGDLSKQFEQLLRTRRLNELEERARSRTPRSSSPASFHNRSSSHSSQQQPRHPQQAPPPVPQLTHTPAQQQLPTYTQYRSLPIVPSLPTDAASLKFRNLLVTLSEYPTKYENPGLLAEALSHVSVDRIYTEAEEEHNVMKGVAASLGDGSKPEWDYQDCVVASLLR